MPGPLQPIPGYNPGAGAGGVGDFFSSLVSALGRYHGYEHRNSLRMANEFALSGKDVYPGAPHDLAQGNVNLNYAHPDARAALISILRSGGGFLRG